MKIAVGLSGGVDSSVAAALLAEQGHTVVGVTMKLWREGAYKGGTKDACFGPGEAEDIARAEALCRQIGIEYRVFDCAAEYEKRVLEYFREEYLNGRTPNPCGWHGNRVFSSINLPQDIMSGSVKKMEIRICCAAWTKRKISLIFSTG